MKRRASFCACLGTLLAFMPSRYAAQGSPEDRIVPDYAPDGQGHLFMARAPDLIFGGPDFVALLCFVRPKGGL